jgi:ATP-binding protein involved in chromosome partitioning
VPTPEEVRDALASVEEPMLGRSLADLDMIAGVAVERALADVRLRVPFEGYPYALELDAAVRDAATALPGINDVAITHEAMTAEQRAAAARLVRPAGTPQAGAQPVIPFAQVDSDTKVLAIASGKGGVGKSSITTNLACALAAEGKRVGVLDADIWGYSIPRMMGASGRPIAFENMVMPLRAHGCKVISIGFFIDTERPVIWRGPMLHRALQQFLADVHWGEVDFLLCDLPPGTGDIAISLAQMLPNADMLVVTTPQQAAQRVALRAGQTTAQTGMRVAGVIENMATFVAPDTGKSYDIFGEGGGTLLAAELGTELLGSIPIDPRLRAGSDDGVPLVLAEPDAPASQEIRRIADTLARRRTSIVGRSLPLQS